MLYVLYWTPNAPLGLRLEADVPNENQLHNFYKVVHKFDDELPDDPKDVLDALFARMQKEEWSPEGEKDDLLSTLKVTHTDMTTGDLVYCDKQKRLWQLKGLGKGFIEIFPDDVRDGKPMDGLTLHSAIPSPYRAVETSTIVPPPPTAWEREMAEYEGTSW